MNDKFRAAEKSATHCHQIKGLSSQLFPGGYQSAFKGKGMSFSEVRLYYPGDDVRAIDWNVTARTGEPFIKVFEEERENTVMLLVDVSGSAVFGSHTQFKAEYLTRYALCWPIRP
ncbi:MAG: DUF58 domain-containing protein [Saprospiraceae bacterium]